MTRYTHGHAPAVLASHGARAAENSAAYVLPRLRAGMSVLDIGCGPGSITLDLAERVAPGRAVGIDPELTAVDAARAAAEGRADTSTRFEVGDVYALDIPDDTYDVVHAHQVLQHVGDPVAALREMARVTRPGGIIAARDADYQAMTWAPAYAGLADWLDVYRALARHNGGEPDAGRHLLRWAHEAGLDDVTASASVWTYADDEARAWWGQSWVNRLDQSPYAASALEAGFVDTSRLERMRADWDAWSRDPHGWFVVVHGEILARKG